MSDLLTNIRARLRDTKEPYRYETAEILNAINHAYCDLIYQFKLNVCKFVKELKPNDFIFHAPKMVLSFEKAFLNAKPLPLKAYDDKALSLQISSFSNFQSFAVLPKHRANGTLEVYLNLAKALNEESTLENGDFLKMALIYKSLSLLFQIESNEGNLQRAGFYENAFKKECDFLRATLSSLTEAKSFHSPCIQY